MPIVGNLSEFPLPEVLLLIGQRTGRLRLLDVPEFGLLEIDVSNGTVQVVRIGANVLIDTSRMLDKLGAIVVTQAGMFEFQSIPVSLAAGPEALTIHDLAIRLVCHVDHQAAQQQIAPLAEQRHKLVLPEPNIWMEPELDQFLINARPLLAISAPLAELARSLKMEIAVVNENLTKLRLLGLIELLETEAPARTEQKVEPRDEIVEKSNAYIRVSRLTDSIRKITSRLPMVGPPLPLSQNVTGSR